MGFLRQTEDNLTKMQYMIAGRDRDSFCFVCTEALINVDAFEVVDFFISWNTLGMCL